MNINNFDALLKSCSTLLYQDQVKLLKTILLKLSDKPERSKVKDISFSISGAEGGIKYGKVMGFGNILSLMMDGNQLYSSILK